jgi:hypothetical protein
MPYLSNRSQEGHLLIDHRNSPGITEADLLLLPESARHRFFPTKGLFECPTIRCCHCGTMFLVNPDRTRQRGHCQKCDHYICDSPVCHANCTPFMQQVEVLHEQAARLLNVKEL